MLDVWLESEPVLAADERLEVARTLAPLASESAARRRLSELLTASVQPNDALQVELSMARQVAALGLARRGDVESLALLGQWLRREPQLATIAARALEAHPPRDVRPLLNAPGAATTLLLHTLEKLRDPRAHAFLRRTLKRATPDVQAAAALALARLGERETIAVAHHWLETKGVAIELLAAAAEILLHFEDGRRQEAFEALLTRSPPVALTLAERYPSPAVVGLKNQLTAYREAGSMTRVLDVLILAGEGGVQAVADAFRGSDTLRSRAAFLLAHSPLPIAHRILREATAEPALRSHALRARVVSHAYVGASDDELVTELEQRLLKGSSTERAIARFGLSVVDEQYSLKLLKSNEPTDLEAAASVFWWHGEDYRRACVRRLVQLSERPMAAATLALSPALSAPGISDELPVSLLVAWLHSGLPVALPAAFQLASRPLPAYEALLHRLVQSPDYELRSATYLGLGRNAAPKYTGALLRALTTELNPEVRMAIAAALWVRPERTAVERATRHAKLFDPDTRVREWLSEGPPAVGSRAGVWIDLPGVPATRHIALSSPARSPIAMQVSLSSAATLLGVDDVALRWRTTDQPVPTSN